MLTVEVKVNGRTILEYSAVNKGMVPGLQPQSQWRKYLAQDGSIIVHRRDDGAAFLAEKLLSKTQPSQHTSKGDSRA